MTVKKQLQDIRCGDNSCVYGSPGGMATNGGCRCYRNMPASREEWRRMQIKAHKAAQIISRVLKEQKKLVEALERIAKESCTKAEHSPEGMDTCIALFPTESFPYNTSEWCGACIADEVLLNMPGDY